MKYLVYCEHNCGAKVILPLKDTLYYIEDFYLEGESGEKLTIEIVEMSEEEFHSLPESYGC